MRINDNLLQAIYNYLLTQPMIEVRDLVQGIEAEAKTNNEPSELIKSLLEQREEKK